ncbi:HIT family protein [Hyphobacterium sp. CCMP332]|uniref:HIT family protein n=1 Tax=Hyphobacterium sp. CCMP332 TaxID=2749086 RepID=UPI00164F8B12|nr:HIT family protein [Hyphobacterium sp. CCMP332]QNL18912.1 HIT family protein [Hyphobacterium sp. CCMP332]
MSLSGTYDDQNIFAKIIAGDAPAIKIFEDDVAVAFMDIFPQSPGHCLVVPKEPARNLLDLSEDMAAKAIQRVQKLARAVEAALQPDGIVVTQFNGAPAGQTVFHIHFHIIPRWEDVPLGRHGGKQADMDELAAQARKIASFLD